MRAVRGEWGQAGVRGGGRGGGRRAGVGAGASCIPSSVLWFSRLFPGLLAALCQLSKPVRQV